MPHISPPESSPPTFGDMLGEVIDLGGGLVVGLLPALLLAVPGIIVFVVLPAIVLLAVALPLAAIGAVVALPPYLVVRWQRRRRSARRPPAAVDLAVCV